jgi:hypothetical protein
MNMDVNQTDEIIAELADLNSNLEKVADSIKALDVAVSRELIEIKKILKAGVGKEIYG